MKAEQKIEIPGKTFIFTQIEHSTGVSMARDKEGNEHYISYPLDEKKSWFSFTQKKMRGFHNVNY